MRRRGGRKRALGTRRPMLMPDRADESWSLDFVSDTLTDGRRFRVLTVVDDCHAGVPGAGGRHIDLGQRGRARTGRASSPARQARHDRQRQRPMSGSSGGFWPADLYAPTTIGAACNLSQMASTVNGIAPCHSKHRIQRRRGSRGPHRP